MALPIPVAANHVMRVTYNQSLFGQRLMSVFHFVCKTSPAGGTSYAQAVQNFADRLADNAIAPLDDWLAAVAPELTFLDVRVQRVWPQRDVYFNTPIALEGTFATGCNMSIHAASVTKKTLFFGPAGVGRTQVGGIPDAVIEDGSLSASYRLQLKTAFEGFLGDITVAADGGKYRSMVWHGFEPSEEDEVFDVFVQDSVRTMHRRTLGLGI